MKTTYVIAIIAVIVIVAALAIFMSFIPKPEEQVTPTPTPSPTPPPLKYDFETGTEGWVAMKGTVTSIEQTTEVAKTGSGSLKCYFDQSMGDDEAIYVEFANPVDLSNKKFSIWVRVPSEAGGVQAKIFVQDANWAWADNQPGIVSFSGKGDTWVEVSWDFAGATGADFTQIKRVGVLIGRWGLEAWSGYLYIDSVNW